MKTFKVIIEEIAAFGCGGMLICGAVFAFFAYLTIGLIIGNPAPFITALIAIFLLGILTGVLLACFGVDEKKVGIPYCIMSIIVGLGVLILICKALFADDKIIHKILGFLSMIVPSIIYAGLYCAFANFGYWLIKKFKSC